MIGPSRTANADILGNIAPKRNINIESETIKQAIETLAHMPWLLQGLAGQSGREQSRPRQPEAHEQPCHQIIIIIRSHNDNDMADEMKRSKKSEPEECTDPGQTRRSKRWGILNRTKRSEEFIIEAKKKPRQ